MEGTAVENTATLRVPPSSAFVDLPRIGLATILRIYRIDPADIGDLMVSVQQAAGELIGDGGDVEIDYRIDDTEVRVDLNGAGRTVRLSAPRP